MCGFVGFIGRKSFKDKDTAKRTLALMSNKIVHRGPDSSGYWINEEGSVGVAHRRLSIVDLTQAGSQPMLSKSKRYIVAYNGEIYNHSELRKYIDQESACQLSWTGNSDTETLLAAIDLWGLEKSLNKIDGMFAFALWDKKLKELFLARDPLGEKPLYYGAVNGSFIFGSELKSFKPHPAFQFELEKNAIALQMRHGFIPTPFSIYKGIKKLFPGSILQIKVNEKMEIINQDCKRFWSFKNIVKKGLNSPFLGSEIEAVSKMENLLLESVKQQMRSDVPVGAFLSGGIDSSTIVALMQKISYVPVKTFSIGFEDKNYNEANYAHKVAKHLKTDHTELYVSLSNVLETLSKLPSIYDEPFSDSSQIPTHLVSKITGDYVKVSLSGDAGDEIFGGYNRYIFIHKLWNILSRAPVFLRSLGAKAITSVRPETWDKFLQANYLLIPNRWKVSNYGEKLHKVARVLPSENIESLYKCLVSNWVDEENLVMGVQPQDIFSSHFSSFDHRLGDVERIMAVDSVTYLPDDILTKVDRAAMSASLETRVPFLNKKVIEFAWQLPLSLKLKDGKGKWIVRQILNKYVPEKLTERPKMGFGIPIGYWLRGPLRDWAEDLINEKKLREENLLNPLAIRRKWKEHLDGTKNWQDPLWNVLIFQQWLDNEKK